MFWIILISHSMVLGILTAKCQQFLTYSIFSVPSLKRIHKAIGLKGTRQQKATFETITPFIQEIHIRFPTMGARQMVTTLRQDYSLKVPEYETSIINLLFS